MPRFAQNLCTLLLACLSLLLAVASPAQAQTLAVASTVPALTIHPGDQNVALPISLTGSGLAGPVTVTLTGLPSGITVTPVVLSPGAAGTLQLSAAVNADQESFSPSAPDNPNTATSTVTLLAVSGTTQATAPLTLTVSLTNPAFTPGKIDLPIVRIDTGNVPITSKDTNVPGTITITSADGATSLLPNASSTDNTATFHVHGNTTALMPKLPYNVKLTTSVDLLTAMGLTCPYVTSAGKNICDKSKSYVLLANYDDKTLLRDWAASALANAIPDGGDFLSEPAGSPTASGTSAYLPWAPHSLFVELFVNGVYEGNYQLIEQVKVDSHRVNITEMKDTDLAGNALTGGYLAEIDYRRDEDYSFLTPQGVSIGLDDPDFTPPVSEQNEFFTNYVDTAEAALFSPGYTDPTNGWRAFFDQTSAINYYIVNDVMGNLDPGKFNGAYLYKDRKNPLIYMGPVWDFDTSVGNTLSQSITDPTVPWMATQNPWYRQWFSDPAFFAAAAQQWNALKAHGVLDTWLNQIAQQATALQQSQTNNFGRWPMQGILVWPNVEAAGSYNAETQFMTAWLKLRIGYLDGFLNKRPATITTLTAPAGPLRAASSVTLSARVAGNQPSGSVTFSYNSIVLGSAPLDATGTASLTTSSLPAGTWYLEAYYDGDNGNSISGALSPAVVVLPPLAESVTNLVASSPTVNYGSSVTFTAAVSGVSGTVAPTGSIAFALAGTPLGTATLNAAGIATLSTSGLSSASNTLTATYSGDINYAGSASATLPVSVVPVDFNFNNAGASLVTVASGNPASFTFNLSPVGPGYPGTVSFSVTGLPTGTGYTLTPSTVASGAGPQSITLALTSGASATGNAREAAAGVAAALLLLLPWGRRRRRWVVAAGGRLFALALLCTLWSGCSSAPAPHTYTIGVQASSGAAQHTSQVTLVVN